MAASYHWQAAKLAVVCDRDARMMFLGLRRDLFGARRMGGGERRHAAGAGLVYGSKTHHLMAGLRRSRPS